MALTVEWLKRVTPESPWRVKFAEHDTARSVTSLLQEGDERFDDKWKECPALQAIQTFLANLFEGAEELADKGAPALHSVVSIDARDETIDMAQSGESGGGPSEQVDFDDLAEIFHAVDMCPGPTPSDDCNAMIDLADEMSRKGFEIDGFPDGRRVCVL